MEFLFRFILFLVSIPLAFVVFCLFFAGSNFAIQKQLAKPFQSSAQVFIGTLLGFSCVMLPAILLLQVAVPPNQIEIQIPLRLCYAPQTGSLFAWFQGHKEKLHSAVCEDDEVVQNFQKKLDSLFPGLTFRCGNLHGKQRELAFLSNGENLRQTDEYTYVILDKFCEKKDPNWLFGRGYSFKKYDDGGIEYSFPSQNTKRISARNSDFCVRAERRQSPDKKIDVHVYTNLPVFKMNETIFPVDQFVRRNLGEDLFEQVLGTVFIHSDTKSSEILTGHIGSLRQSVLDQMNSTDRERFACKVCHDECIQEIASVTSSPDGQKTPRLIYQSNPFLKVTPGQKEHPRFVLE